MKRKLLISTDNFLPRWDGISRFLAEIIPRLKDKYEITVIAPDLGPSPVDNSTSFRYVKVPLSGIRIGDFMLANPHFKVLRREIAKSDIVFNQTIGPIGIKAISAAKKERKKVISYIHSIEWELATRAMGVQLLKYHASAIAKRLVRHIYRKVDMLIFPSQSIAELFSWHRIEKQKMIVHLGVDTKRFVPPESKSEAKKKLGLEPDAWVIGYHGRIGREKDLTTLLRAFIILKKANPHTSLLIVGDGVESIKHKLASVPGVILPGSTNNPVPYLQAMDVYCLPSLTETTSLSTIEAMACGIPVIVNKVGFLKDYIKDGKNGLFFHGGDSYDLAKQVLLLKKNPEYREKLGERGRQFVEKEFDWESTAKKIDEAIEKMLGRGDHGRTHNS